MEDLDLKELFAYYIRRWLVLAISLAAFLLIGVIYTIGVKKPLYASSTTLVLTRIGTGDEAEQITTTDVQLNKQLISSYREIIKSKKVLRQVQDQLDLIYSINDLSSMVQISTVKDTELINIRVNSKNKQETAKIANKIADIFSEEIQILYNIENVKIVDVAEASNSPYNINPVKDIFLFAVVGIVLGSIVVFILFYFDTNIKTVEEIEKKVGLPILGEVPLEVKKNGGKRK